MLSFIGLRQLLRKKPCYWRSLFEKTFGFLFSSALVLNPTCSSVVSEVIKWNLQLRVPKQRTPHLC